MGQARDLIQQWFSQPDPALYADDIDWYVPGYPVPQERYIGRAAVTEEFFPAMRRQFSAFKAELNELLECGDRVTAIGRYVGTTKAGVDIVVPFLHVWTVRDGKIAGVIAAAETSRFVRALG
jgi:hypothetical protein